MCMLFKDEVLGDRAVGLILQLYSSNYGHKVQLPEHRAVAAVLKYIDLQNCHETQSAFTVVMNST